MEGLPQAALEAYLAVSEPEGGLPRLIHDPPYTHQADAIRGCLINGKNLVIMTGTGSGKTEAFLLPILGKFAHEAKTRPTSFVQHTAIARAHPLSHQCPCERPTWAAARSVRRSPAREALQKVGRPSAAFCPVHKQDTICERSHGEKGFDEA